MADWEVVIGLEVHAELDTQSKIFCGCSTRFGAPPNTQTCPVCLGLPGSLPVMNRRAFELALRAAVAFNCRISQHTIWERKNYFYPDLPKAYQISQKAIPLGRDGWIEIPVDGGYKRIGLEDVHLEEDTGKSIHGEAAGVPDSSLIDFNRAGMPLLEIVSKPDMRSVAEAEAYMNTIRGMLVFLGVSDCKMEEGSLRFEASCSMRPAGSDEFGSRVEIKNLNSFRAVVGALEADLRRQRALLESGKPVPMQTMLWNEARGITEPMRSKEEAHDYRYFPEPDLAPVDIDDAWLERVRADLPEMPLARRRRFCEQYGLDDDDAAYLTTSREAADFFETAAGEHGQAQAVVNWMRGDFAALLNEDGIDIDQSRVTPQHLVGLLRLIDDGTISGKIAKEVFAEMHRTGDQAEAIVERRGLKQISDASQLDTIIDQIIADNPKAADDFRGGNQKTLGFFVGQVMKATRGQANPQLVNQMLRDKLEG